MYCMICSCITMYHAWFLPYFLTMPFILTPAIKKKNLLPPESSDLLRNIAKTIIDMHAWALTGNVKSNLLWQLQLSWGCFQLCKLNQDWNLTSLWHQNLCGIPFVSYCMQFIMLAKSWYIFAEVAPRLLPYLSIGMIFNRGRWYKSKCDQCPYFKWVIFNTHLKGCK